MSEEGMPPGPMLEAFDRHRALLFSIAHRMLGSVADAEEAVRKSRSRWLQTTAAAGRGVRSPEAYLSTVVISYCLTRLRAAPSRREEYVGPWLPEPLADQGGSVEECVARLDCSRSTAFLLVLESLTPAERAIFLPQKVFGYDLAEVTSLVDESETNCSQIVRRAKRSVVARWPRFKNSSEREEDRE
jgi:RNA polymerase sigma-70 factor (ECF subfamily)